MISCPSCSEQNEKLQTLAQCGACDYIVFHFMCSTCEHERLGLHGYGAALRKYTMEPVPAKYKHEQFCCCCGQDGSPAAVFKGFGARGHLLRGGCQGSHETVPDDLDSV